MVHKDPTARKAYQREWIKRHRATSIGKQKSKAITQRWRKNNPEMYLKQKRRWYYRHREDALARLKAKKASQRRQVLEHYGGTPPTCSCCGESNYAFLTLEHLNGGGTKHRKSVGPSNLMASIIKEGFPAGYGVLCYNCNCAKAFTGICPHAYELERAVRT